jgi:hypothetical protein
LLKTGAGSRDWLVLALIAGAAVAAIPVFAPWQPPGFVSDSWYLLRSSGELDLAELAGRFIPTALVWYRPLTDIGFWALWQAFGTDPLGSFLVHIVSHVVTAGLLGLVVLRLTAHRVAAVATGIAFLFVLQAHEVVWDHSALHFSLSSVPFAGSVLAYVHGRRKTALLLTVICLLADETGAILVAVFGAYELAFLDWRKPHLPGAIRDAAWRLIPSAAVVGTYFAIRLGVGGNIYSEANGLCISPSCIVLGTMEYIDRLALRGDPLIAPVRDLRPETFAALVVVIGVGLVMLRPWNWANRRPALFGLGWTLAASVYFVIALWMYVADRFVYVPAMGVAVLLGAVVPELASQLRSTSRRDRIGAASVSVLVVLWIGLGAWTVLERGQRWVAAGERAKVLAAGVDALVPDPQPGLFVIVAGQPHSLRPVFPPGNTGPYVFLNGMEWMMRSVYSWPASVRLPSPRENTSPPSDAQVIYLYIDDDRVQLGSPPPQ